MKLKKISTKQLRNEAFSSLTLREGIPTDEHIVNQLVGEIEISAQLACTKDLSIKERLEALCKTFRISILLANRDLRQLIHPLPEYDNYNLGQHLTFIKWIELFSHLLDTLYEPDGLMLELKSSPTGLVCGPYRNKTNQFHSSDAVFLVYRQTIRLDLRTLFSASMVELSPSYFEGSPRRAQNFLQPFVRGYFGSQVAKLNQRVILGGSYYTFESPTFV